jgi:putative serine protease PepD
VVPTRGATPWPGLVSIVCAVPDHDDADDVPVSGPLPSPDDRLWRHPSELGALGPGAMVTGPQNPRSNPRRNSRHSPRQTASVALAGSVLGAAAMLAAVLALGGFDGRGPVTAVEQIQLSQPKDPAPTELAIAEKALPAIAQVTVTNASGSSAGTAVVFRNDGHLITTADLLDGAVSLTVELYDGTVLPARVVGVDRGSDLAVLKVDHSKMAVAALAMESDLQLGEPTIAVECLNGKPGSPNLSVGLVSALGRRVDASDGSSLHDMIQTNVRLTANGAGSVLLDSRGAVIGLVTRRGMPGSTNGGVMSVSTAKATLVPRYATPIEYAKQIADELILTGRAAHPWIGVESHEIDALGHGGARLDRVTAGSPAANAGLEAGDVVVGVDGTAVESSSDLVVALRRHRLNESVGVTYLRSGEAGVGLVTLADRPALP